MVRANNKGLADYGLLAQSYFERFEQKWIVRDVTPVEDLLGADDFSRWQISVTATPLRA